MRSFCLALSAIIILAVSYIIAVNFNTYTNISYYTVNSPISVKTAYFTALILGFGLLAGAGIVYTFLAAQKDKVKAYRRELEKTTISGTNNASKVEVLEAKIKTLEKAFNTVIDERTKLEVQIKNLNSEIEAINKQK